MPRYRVFCSAEESEQLPPGVSVIERYPAFAVVSASDAAIEEIKQRYPIEAMPSAPAPEFGVAVRATALPESAAGARDIVVRFDAPVRAEWRREIEATGAKIRAALGGSALVVCCPSDRVAADLTKHSRVARIDAHVPELKISGEFLSSLTGSATSATVEQASAKLARGATAGQSRRGARVPGLLVARFLSAGDRREAAKALRRSGHRRFTQIGNDRLVIDVAQATDAASLLQQIIGFSGLKRVEEKTIKTQFNDLARRAIGSGVVHGSNPGGPGLTGHGEIVAVADSGLDTGDAATVHLDFRGHVRAIESWPLRPSLDSLVTNPGGDDGPSDRFSGHGTHVAGSAVGNGAQAAALGLDPIQGMAPQADLVFQAIEQSPAWTLQAQLYFLKNGMQPPAHGLFGIPDDLTDLFQQAYDHGARIHSNSWGGGDAGAYDEQCEDLDRFVWDHPDFLVVVAAGNSGQDVSPPGQGIDLTSVDSPGTAKNCLTVGACENNRPGFTERYGTWWPSDFPQAPFDADSMTDSVDDVVAFSSRGPCNTGRRKPDLIAPGTFVLSTRSSQIAANHYSWGAFPAAKQHYMHMGGTSMATPLVSGAAALVRQHIRTAAGLASPSAALVKAAMIHSAQYHPYRWAHPSSARWADNEQGWGRVDLRQVLAAAAPTRVLGIDYRDGLSTGEMQEYRVIVNDPSVPLRVTLVYSDFPGENLVNNLNLVVFDPHGGYYLGNDFDRTNSPDATNNVEGIIVESPVSATWRVRVVASEVLEGTQDFALLISGGGVAWG